jgi:hypothetical protein
MATRILDTFITDVASVLSSTDDEHQITELVAERLSALLASGYRLPPDVTRPSSERHVTYPHRSRRKLVTGVRGLEPRSTHTRAFPRDMGCGRHLLWSRTRTPLPQARCD